MTILFIVFNEHKNINTKLKALDSTTEKAFHSAKNNKTKTKENLLVG